MESPSDPNDPTLKEVKDILTLFKHSVKLNQRDTSEQLVNLQTQVEDLMEMVIRNLGLFTKEFKGIKKMQEEILDGVNHAEEEEPPVRSAHHNPPPATQGPLHSRAPHPSVPRPGMPQQPRFVPAVQSPRIGGASAASLSVRPAASSSSKGGKGGNTPEFRVCNFKDAVASSLPPVTQQSLLEQGTLFRGDQVPRTYSDLEKIIFNRPEFQDALEWFLFLTQHGGVQAKSWIPTGFSCYNIPSPAELTGLFRQGVPVTVVPVIPMLSEPSFPRSMDISKRSYEFSGAPEPSAASSTSSSSSSFIGQGGTIDLSNVDDDDDDDDDDEDDADIFASRGKKRKTTSSSKPPTTRKIIKREPNTDDDAN
jgi:hypothetical protein